MIPDIDRVTGIVALDALVNDDILRLEDLNGIVHRVGCATVPSCRPTSYKNVCPVGDVDAMRVVRWIASAEFVVNVRQMDVRTGGVLDTQIALITALHRPAMEMQVAQQPVALDLNGACSVKVKPAPVEVHSVERLARERLKQEMRVSPASEVTAPSVETVHAIDAEGGFDCGGRLRCEDRVSIALLKLDPVIASPALSEEPLVGSGFVRTLPAPPSVRRLKNSRPCVAAVERNPRPIRARDAAIALVNVNAKNRLVNLVEV